MSLADQIADNTHKEESPNQNIDEFGIPVPTPETPEYWVARALIRNNATTDDLTIDCIHLRGDQLFLRHTPLKEDEETLYRLTGLRHPVKKWERVAFYEALRKYVPRLNRNFLYIGENCYWDIKRAEIIDKETAIERSRAQ